MAAAGPDHSTTFDDRAGAPRLEVFAPLAGAVLALLAASCIAIAALALIAVPASHEFEARLVADPAAATLVAPRAGDVASIAVEDGALVAEGDVIVSLATTGLSEQARLLGEDAVRIRLRLDAARRDDADGSATGEDGAERTRRLGAALAEITQRLAATEADLLSSTLKAPRAGRVGGLSRVRAAHRLEARDIVAVIEPARGHVTVEALVPSDLVRLDWTGASPNAIRAYPIDAAVVRVPLHARMIGVTRTQVSDAGGTHSSPATAVRFEIQDPSGALGRGRPAGDVVASIAIDADATKPIVNTLMAQWRRLVAHGASTGRVATGGIRERTSGRATSGTCRPGDPARALC